MSNHNKFLVYTTVTSWDEPPRARHQLTHELKKDGEVYFVEKNKEGLPSVKIREAEENVYVITPYYPVNYRIRYRTPGINEMYHRWLLSKLSGLGAFDMVVTFDYTAPAIHDFFDNVLFYCADDNVGFGNFNPFFVNAYHARTERKVAERAKLCIVTSAYMQEKIGRYNPKTYTVPLGAPAIEIAQIPYEKRSGRPVLGLVGFLDSNLDYVLIENLLKKFEIHFIGPAKKENRERLSRSANAKILGVKTGNELYESLRQVDVCVAPYDPAKINKGATPNKMWLYLALGKPAVVTEIPNIRSWEFGHGMIYKCSNSDFAYYCQKAFDEDNSDLTEKRKALSKKHSWENRVKQIRELFAATGKQKDSIPV